MNRSQIIELQERIGTTPDGFWGRKSVAACQRHLKALMPQRPPFPPSDPESLNHAYGDPGKGQVEKRLVMAHVTGLGVRYEGRPVERIRCHPLVRESLVRVLTALSASEESWVLESYAGCYNHRPMRGGTSWSLHAYGAAIDLDAGRNGLHTHWPTRAIMPIEVMEAFAREGWLPAGAFWGRDAMHFQATQ